MVMINLNAMIRRILPSHHPLRMRPLQGDLPDDDPDDEEQDDQREQPGAEALLLPRRG